MTRNKFQSRNKLPGEHQIRPTQKRRPARHVQELIDAVHIERLEQLILDRAGEPIEHDEYREEYQTECSKCDLTNRGRAITHRGIRQRWRRYIPGENKHGAAERHEARRQVILVVIDCSTMASEMVIAEKDQRTGSPASQSNQLNNQSTNQPINQPGNEYAPRAFVIQLHIITGADLAHFASACTGKLTYLSASYWETDPMTLASDGTANR